MPPPHVHNATRTLDDIVLGSGATYTCISDHWFLNTRKSSHTITCTENGDWSETPIDCEGNVTKDKKM